MTIIDDRFDEFCVCSVFNTVLLCLTLSTMSKVISENRDLFRKRVLCMLGSIFCLWFVNCFQRGGYQVLNGIRDFEENGL